MNKIETMDYCGSQLRSIVAMLEESLGVDKAFPVTILIVGGMEELRKLRDRQ